MSSELQPLATFLSLLGLGIVIHAGYYFFKSRSEPAGPYHAPWRPLEAITITISAYFVSQLLAIMALRLISVFTGGSLDADALESSVILTFLTVALFEIFIVLIIGSFLRRRKATLRSVGLIPPKKKDLLYALSGYGIYFIMYLTLFIVAQALLPQIDFNQSQELGFDTTTTGPALVLVFLSLVILPPVVEEFVCRGFLYSGLRTKLGKISAAIIVSIIFAAAHLQFGSGNALLWVAAMDTFVLSMVLVYLRDKTGGLTAPIIVHMIKNSIAFLALFVFKAV